jgi:hypothetical protein
LDWIFAPSRSRGIGPWKDRRGPGPQQERPEPLEIHRLGQPFQRIAFSREFLQAIFNIPETPLPLHAAPHPIIKNRKSWNAASRHFLEVSIFLPARSHAVFVNSKSHFLQLLNASPTFELA